LTALISGPKQAGNDIDVFLEPLMEDMQKLWECGVTMWDEYSRQRFNLKAIIFYTINDNPARFSLTGQVKGKAGCVVFGKLMKGIKMKKNEKASKDSLLKKKSIFFRYLPYWKEFDIGHTIDTMHVTKGVFQSTISLLLDLARKMKDGLNAHKVLQVLGIKEELHPQERLNGKVNLPPASYTHTN
jgi:hypothetical protein